MPDDRLIPLPEPGTLRVSPPPYLRARPGLASVTRAFVIAAGLVLIAGLVLFGWNTIRVLAICIASAVLVDSATRAVAGRSEKGAEGQALLLGMLTACTLPPTVYWPVPLLAAAIAVLAGHVIAGGLGNYLWHPAALGRIAVQILFPVQLSPARWPVLGPDHLLWGDLTAARALPFPATWASHPLPYGAQAWQVVRPADALASAVPAADDSPARAIATLVSETLPPWWHTLTGAAGGAIGEACGMVVIAAGLLLMWRGLARWSLPVMGVFMAALMAAILPVTIQHGDGTATWHWLPGLCLHNGLPVGLLYVLYHLTAGEFLFVLMLLAADPTSSPLTRRGHTMHGTIIGGLTVILRVITGVSAAGYWALLIANTLVPLVNRATRRRVFGT